MTGPVLNTAPDMTFRTRAARIELTVDYHVDSGPVRHYRNRTARFTVSNVRVAMKAPSSWQAILSGVDTVTGKSIGEGQLVGDAANEKTMGWLRPIVEDAQERYAAALEQADR